MNLKIWRAKRLLKKIEKNQAWIVKLALYKASAEKWIKQDTRRLNKILKSMSQEDYISFGIQTGYMEKRK